MAGRWLLRLYPEGWRARYEEEVLFVLDEHGCTFRTLVDLALGALDAWLVLPRFREENLIAMSVPGYPGTTRTRPGGAALTIAVAALSAAFFVLLTYALFVGFPMLTQTGDAHLQRWLGPAWARWGYLALGLVVAGAYGTVAVRGNTDGGPGRSRSVLTGAGVGAVSGLVAIAALTLVTLIARHPGQLTPSSVVILLLLLIGPAVAGVVAGLLTGQGLQGLLAGFWCGVVFALVTSIGLLTRDVAFAGLLDHTAWVGDHFGDQLCNGARGATLAACEVGDDFGFAASLLLIGPLLGGLVGVLGSALATLGRKSPGPVTWRWSRSTTALVAFSTTLLVLFVVEAATSLW